jgi:fumarylpyruvate hydrolase
MDFVISPPNLVSGPIVGSTACSPVGRIYCVGRNYVAHAQEMGFTGREPPFFFIKPSDNCLPVPAGTTGTLHYPSLTNDYQHEIELVACVGQGGKNIKAADAIKHIWGFAVGLDMTRRDRQSEQKKLGRPWCVGKTFDESCPIGPITPAAQAGDIQNAEIWVKVNGQDRQRSRISQLIWNLSETIEHLTTAWELRPGDLIYTGTPEGVAAVVSGDTLVGGITGLESITLEVA